MFVHVMMFSYTITEPTEGPEVDAAQDEGRPKKETERKVDAYPDFLNALIR